jgi:hypothetical protein
MYKTVYNTDVKLAIPAVRAGARVFAALGKPSALHCPSPINFQKLI